MSELVLVSFKQSCLLDLDKKLQCLPDLQAEATLSLRTQAEEGINEISKVFVNLEDNVVRLLRERIRLLFAAQQATMANELQRLELNVGHRVQEMKEEIAATRSMIEAQGLESKKILGKYAQGKIQRRFDDFSSELKEVQLAVAKIEYSLEEVEEAVGDILELLNIKYPGSSNLIGKAGVLFNEANSRKNSTKHDSNVKNEPTIPNDHVLKNQSIAKNESIIKNESILSQVISELPSQEERAQEIEDAHSSERSNGGDEAILQHKRAITLKKKQRVEQKIKQADKKESNTISSIAALALERQRLLRQME